MIDSLHARCHAGALLVQKVAQGVGERVILVFESESCAQLLHMSASALQLQRSSCVSWWRTEIALCMHVRVHALRLTHLS